VDEPREFKWAGPLLDRTRRGTCRPCVEGQKWRDLYTAALAKAEDAPKVLVRGGPGFGAQSGPEAGATPTQEPSYQTELERALGRIDALRATVDELLRLERVVLDAIDHEIKCDEDAACCHDRWRRVYIVAGRATNVTRDEKREADRA
jgi:hypothetical protein